MEIKEILGILRRCTYGDEVYLIKEHGATLLLDYITNLQQENEELKEYLKIMEKGKDNNLNRFLDYKSRIEKAVEYIKDNAKYQKATINNNKYYNEYLINQVLNILNGRSDE